MTRYAWESGTIIIPTAQWAKFKKQLRDRYNVENDRVYEVALKLHEALLTLGKGKRNFDWRAALEGLMRETTRASGYYAQEKLKYDLGDDDDLYDKVQSAIMPRDAKRPLKPLKKDFPRATEKTVHFKAGYPGNITFDDAQHAVRWSVDENNHSVETARDSVMGVALFRALNAVQWSRNSGGVIAGNDEYNRDDRDAGGGANTINGAYGPLGARERDAQNAARFAFSPRRRIVRHC